MENILSILIFFPAVAAIVGFLIHKDSMRQFAIVVTVVEFILSVMLWYNFDIQTADMQFVQNIVIGYVSIPGMKKNQSCTKGFCFIQIREIILKKTSFTIIGFAFPASEDCNKFKIVERLFSILDASALTNS